MNMTCEQVTDLLPELAAGTLDDASASAVRAHITTCDECAAEWSLISSLRAAAPAVPADLASRISATVRARPVAARTWGAWGARQATARHLTLAATFAVAMIGGGIALQQARESAPVVQVPTGDTTTASTANTNVAPVATPVLGSGSVIPEMSEAQLEALLKEMGS
jgi:anti-sigma factor RsiW